MIERIGLENFQCHKSLTVDLDRYVTTFVGPSDRGKSSVMRALRWVMANPTGAAFVRHGAKTASVTVTVDGIPIVRRRGPDNVYVFDGETYASLRAATVPDKIAQVLNLSSVAFMNQHDGPFWLTDTPGQVSRNLNTIINLGEIDDTLARASADIRRLRADVDAAERLVAQSKAQRDRLAWAPKFAAAVESLAAVEREYQDAERRFHHLDGLVRDAESAMATRDAWARVTAAGEAAVAAATATIDAQTKADRLDSLLDAADRAQAILAVDVGPAWDRLAAIRAAGNAAADRCGTLDYLIRDAERWEVERCEADEELARLEAALVAACEEKCPMCGAPADPLRFSPPTGTHGCNARLPVPRQVTDGVEYSLPTFSGSKR